MKRGWKTRCVDIFFQPAIFSNASQPTCSGLTEGKALFDVGVLDAVLAAENNNERYDALVRLKDEVLPHYDDLQGGFSEVREKLKGVWLVVGETETVPYETPFGDFGGHEPHQVTGQIAEIMQQYRYVQLGETYAFVHDLYVQTSDTESRNQLVKLAESIASPTREICQRYGPLVQVRLAEALSKEEDFASIAPLAIAIASKILKPDITGASSSSTTVTFHRGAIVYSGAPRESPQNGCRDYRCVRRERNRKRR